MDYNYTLKYRSFDQLLDEVRIDFKNFNLENKIEPAQLIKIAMKVNYDLGLRISQTKQALLNIEHGRAKLPDNFYVMNYAVLCGEYTVSSIVPSGTNIQEVPYVQYQETQPAVDVCGPTTVNCRTCNSLPCCCQTAGCLTTNTADPCPTPVYDPNQPYGNPCIKPRVFLDCKDNAWELIQIVSTETRTYRHFERVRFRNSQFVECDCPNLNQMCANDAYIRDGFVWTSLKTCNMYINYQGAMEDDNGVLLVPDHPMLNEYYEYAIKERLLENLAMEGENVGNQLQLIIQKLRMARNIANGIVNTPNFSEMQKLWALNRKAMYSKYYDMFKSYNGPSNLTRINNAV